MALNGFLICFHHTGFYTRLTHRIMAQLLQLSSTIPYIDLYVTCSISTLSEINRQEHGSFAGAKWMKGVVWCLLTNNDQFNIIFESTWRESISEWLQKSWVSPPPLPRWTSQLPPCAARWIALRGGRNVAGRHIWRGCRGADNLWSSHVF